MAIGLMTSGEGLLSWLLIFVLLHLDPGIWVCGIGSVSWHSYLVSSFLSWVPFFSCCYTLWVPAQCGGCELTGREGLSGSPGVLKECREVRRKGRQEQQERTGGTLDLHQKAESL